jgi:preprotein translocase subunit YajC
LLELRSAVLSLLLPILLIVVFWFLLMRPQQKRQAALRQLQSSLAPGEEVLLTSGIYATVVEVADDHVVVNIASGVDIRVVRGAIGQVVPRPETGEPAETTASDVAEPETPTQAEDH